MTFIIDLQIILINFAISFYLFRKWQTVTQNQEKFIESVTIQQEKFIVDSQIKITKLESDLSDLQNTVVLLKMYNAGKK